MYAVRFRGIGVVLGKGIHNVLVDAVGASRICAVAVNIFCEDVSNQGSGFDESFSTRHDNGVIVMDDEGVIFGDVYRFHSCFP